MRHWSKERAQEACGFGSQRACSSGRRCTAGVCRFRHARIPKLGMPIATYLCILSCMRASLCRIALDVFGSPPPTPPPPCFS
eukprot:362010-Chlamydomonas_euryale.AAC.2